MPPDSSLCNQCRNHPATSITGKCGYCSRKNDIALEKRLDKARLEHELYPVWNEADELCASFATSECLTDPDSLRAMQLRAIEIRDTLSKIISYG